jgi:Arm DNA-binding domain/Phage integrase SAM-like domain
MQQPIRLIVRKGKVRSDGTALISLQYCYSAEQRVVLSTGIGIPLQYWNRKTRRISKDLPLAYGNVQQLETGITEKLRKAEDMVTYALKQKDTCPMKFLKDNFHLQENWKLEQMSAAEKNLDIYFNIDDYVKSKQSTVKHCTIDVINAMKAHLKSFESFRKEPITFDSFDVRFYEDFVKLLTYDIIKLRRK